jgi:glutathione S-transferase
MGFPSRAAPAERAGAIARRCILETTPSRLALVLKLIATLTSPYARKVRIALAEKKFEYTLIEDSPWVAGNGVAEINPLGKIPVLVLDDGTRLFDSRVIVEYLDTVSPVSRLIPEPSRQRIAVKRWEALADGICDAAAAVFLERKRPLRQQSKDWIVRQRAKIDRSVVEIAQELGERAWCNGEAYSLADIATGCALSYLDLRFPEIDWRGAHPNLVALADKLAARPSFADTVPPAP